MASNFPPQIQGTYPPQRVQYMPVKAAQSFIVGALVKLTSGEAEECGSDPTAVLGIALAPASVGLATAGSIYGGTNIPIYCPGTDDIIFMASATTPVAATHIGTAYGVVKSTNWLLDISETSADVLLVVRVSNSPQQEGFYCRFVADVLTLDAIAT